MNIVLIRMLCEFEAIVREVVASSLFGVLLVNLFCLKSGTDIFFSFMKAMS